MLRWPAQKWAVLGTACAAATPAILQSLAATAFASLLSVQLPLQLKLAHYALLHLWQMFATCAVNSGKIIVRIRVAASLHELAALSAASE